MKWSLLFIPIFLLIFINACVGLGATVATATPTWTPTLVFLPTEDTLSPAIFSELNMAIEGMVTSEPLNELEHIAGPSYQVTSGLLDKYCNELNIMRLLMMLKSRIRNHWHISDLLQNLTNRPLASMFSPRIVYLPHYK
jgi:hypothetical protein